MLACLEAAERRVIFPLHPRTRKSLEAWGLEVPANVEVRDAVTYTEMLALERGAVAIATDSGGVQREAYLWGVPCITMREETEWIETVSTGWNTLVGVDAEKFRAALAKPRPAERPPIFGDGNAAERIAELTVAHLDRALERVRMSEQLRVGVVGCGRMGALPHPQLRPARLRPAGRGRRSRRRGARRRALGETRVAEYSDWRELIEFGADELDAVSIACPPSATPRSPSRRSPPACTCWSRSRSRRPFPTRCGCAAPRSRPTAS